MMATYLYRNPHLLVVIVAVVVVAGLSSLHVLPRMEDPILTQRVALVTTLLPGADAARVESQITERLERPLRRLAEVKSVQSNSQPGSSLVVVELRDDVSDVEPVWSKVRDRVADTQSLLPRGATASQFRQLPLRAYASIIAVRSNRVDAGDAPDFMSLQRIADELESELRRIPGTMQVDRFGDGGSEVAVTIEPETLVPLGLTVSDVADQISAGNASGSAGLVRARQHRLLLTVADEGDDWDRLRSTPIIYGDRGRFVRLSELATVTRGREDPPIQLATVDARGAIVLGTLIRDDVRIDQWSRRLEVTLRDFRRGLPDDVDADVMLTQNDYVEDRLRGLLESLAIGTAAVIVVVFLLMGWRSMIVVAIALPLSAAMVLAGMRIIGIPIHQMSITGLIIALGLLIDNAIIVVDDVRSRVRSGSSVTDAIGGSVRHLAVPLFGSTFTTTLAFAPIAMLPGAPGEFVWAIAVSVILAINSSFLLAMTVTAALSAWLQTETASGASFRDTGFRSDRLTSLYTGTLRFVFGHPWIGIALGIGLPLVGFVKAPTLPEQFFPAADRNQIQIELELDASSSIVETSQAADEVGRYVRQRGDVRRVHWFVGQSAPTFYYNVVPRRFRCPFYAQAIIELDDQADARETIVDLQEALDGRFAGYRLLVRQLEQGPPMDAPVEIRVRGPELTTLQELGDEIRLLLSQTTDVLHTRSDLSGTQLQITAESKRAYGRMAGLTQMEMTGQVHAALEGVGAGTFRDDFDDELPIRVRLSSAARGDLDRLSLIPFRTRNRPGVQPPQGPGVQPLQGPGAQPPQGPGAQPPKASGPRRRHDSQASLGKFGPVESDCGRCDNPADRWTANE